MGPLKEEGGGLGGPVERKGPFWGLRSQRHLAAVLSRRPKWAAFFTQNASTRMNEKMFGSSWPIGM